jgi:hypothetical protein
VDVWGTKNSSQQSAPVASTVALMLSEIPVNIRLSVLIPATIFSPVSYNEVFGNTLSNTDVWTDQVATDRRVVRTE